MGKVLQPNEFLLSEVLPGQIGLVELDDEEVAIFNIDGKYYATHNACTHAEGPMNTGTLRGKDAICPWHGSCFDVTNGEVTCGPATEAIKTYRVIIDGEIGRVEE
jgi:nitrite reductase/ring-hydroxylating ferredoxin subunit